MSKDKKNTKDNNIVDKAGDVLKDVGNAVKDGGEKVVDAVKNTGAAVADGLQDAGQAVTEFLGEKFEKNQVRLWFADDIGTGRWPELKIKEIASRSNVGIAFSGGGLRSATASLGAMRALHQLKVVEKIRYVGCISGGSWFAIPWTYLPAKFNDTDFLGHYSPPQQLNPQDMIAQFAEPQASLFMNMLDKSELLNKENIAKVLDQDTSLGNSSKDEIWGEFVGKSMLKGIGRYHQTQRYATYTTSVRQTLLDRNANLQESDFDCVEKPRPYLLINACIINWNVMAKLENIFVRDKALQPKDYPFYPFEFTPMYSGINVKYKKDDTTGIFTCGGGYIENIGFDTKDPGKIDSNCVKLQVRKDFNRLSVQDMMASSGAAVAFTALHLKMLANAADVVTFAAKLATGPNPMVTAADKAADVVRKISSIFPRYHYWHLAEEKNVRTQHLYFGDGGFLDNYGIMPLLRRQVKNILVYINTDVPLSGPPITQDDVRSLKTWRDNDNDLNKIEMDGGLPCLFGVPNAKAAHGMPHRWCGHKMQIFKQDEFAPMINAMLKRKGDGGPVYYRNEKIKVLKNEFFGVKHEYDANICFIMLQDCPSWTKQIQGEYRRRLDNRQQDASLAGFPNYGTFGLNKSLEDDLTVKEKVEKYTDLQEMNREQVYLLSNLMTWTTLEVFREENLQDFFD